ncbi:6316_t:CDS:2 [Acaulospora morrowiae]|uniref:6316_t:CDS:1 n=1 Tax=Acaulospora morrowiae TaxID=94023 RepID=A0A9N8V664_9GLOM|nr:6316_t:CDS:2 [Acaulospora morrowiae]
MLFSASISSISSSKSSILTYSLVLESFPWGSGLLRMNRLSLGLLF